MKTGLSQLLTASSMAQLPHTMMLPLESTTEISQIRGQSREKRQRLLFTKITMIELFLTILLC